jgi:hypothetical protein
VEILCERLLLSVPVQGSASTNLSGLGTNPWALPSDAAGGAHELAVRPGQSAGYGASQGDLPWGQAAALGPHRSLLSQQWLGGACEHAGAAEALAQRRNVVDDFRLLEVAAACLRGLHGEEQLGNAWLASDRIGSDQIRSDRMQMSMCACNLRECL